MRIKPFPFVVRNLLGLALESARENPPEHLCLLRNGCKQSSLIQGNLKIRSPNAVPPPQPKIQLNLRMESGGGCEVLVEHTTRLPSHSPKGSGSLVHYTPSSTKLINHGESSSPLPPPRQWSSFRPDRVCFPKGRVEVYG